MSKAFSSSMAKIDAKVGPAASGHGLALFDQVTGLACPPPFASQDGIEILVPKGARWLLLERSGWERIHFRVDLQEGSILEWLNCRPGGGKANARKIVAVLQRGARLTHRESLRLEAGEALAQSWQVEMSHAESSCSIMTRLAQNDGSAACLAYNANLLKGSEGSTYDQVAKSMKAGDACSTLIEPNLVVQARQVQAKHGASHGQLDILACHALTARGFSMDQASRMLTQAFLDSAWDGIELGYDHRVFLEDAHG